MTIQKQATETLNPQATTESSTPLPAKATVDVWYASEGGSFEIMSGQTAQQILRDSKIRETCGYGALDDANLRIMLDGKELGKDLPVDTIVQEGQQIEVLRQAGEKA